jgi:hypothetical protein
MESAPIPVVTVGLEAPGCATEQKQLRDSPYKSRFGFDVNPTELRFGASCAPCQVGKMLIIEVVRANHPCLARGQPINDSAHEVAQFCTLECFFRSGNFGDEVVPKGSKLADINRSY